MSRDARSIPVFVTRPLADATPLVERLREQGREAQAFPVLAIEPPADPRPLARAMESIDAYRLVVFVSPNAIRAAFAALARPWPAAVAIGAMGPGSARALADVGLDPAVPVHVPDERFDSEGLLDVLDAAVLSRADARPILLVRGSGGRPWLALRLRERGHRVDEVEAYRRTRPRPAPDASARIEAAFSRREPIALVVTSSEGIANLVASLHDVLAAADVGERSRWIFANPLHAPHPRIVETARAAGFTDVRATRAGDDGIAAALGAALP